MLYILLYIPFWEERGGEEEEEEENTTSSSDWLSPKS